MDREEDKQVKYNLQSENEEESGPVSEKSSLSWATLEESHSFMGLHFLDRLIHCHLSCDMKSQGNCFTLKSK